MINNQRVYKYSSIRLGSDHFAEFKVVGQALQQGPQLRDLRMTAMQQGYPGLVKQGLMRLENAGIYIDSSMEKVVRDDDPAARQMIGYI